MTVTYQICAFEALDNRRTVHASNCFQCLAHVDQFLNPCNFGVNEILVSRSMDSVQCFSSCVFFVLLEKIVWWFGKEGIAYEQSCDEGKLKNDEGLKRPSTINFGCSICHQPLTALVKEQLKKVEIGCTNARMNWPRTIDPLVMQRKSPRSSGRTVSPIQTGEITNTIPKPIAIAISRELVQDPGQVLTVD